MAYEHESGLPHAYDRAVGKPEQQGVVFYGDRPFIQAAELNELQTVIRTRSVRNGRLIAKDGNRIERAEIIIDVEAGTATMTAGSIYVAGDVFPVSEAVLTAVPMVGRVEIGVRLTKEWITHEADPDLLGSVPGSLAEGEPGAAREIASIAWARGGDAGAGPFYAVYALQDGTVLDQTSPSVLDPIAGALSVYDRPNGNYVVSGCRVTALGAEAGAQMFSIEQGEANIFGFKKTRYAAIRFSQIEDWDEMAVPGETKTYPGGASYTFAVDQFPIGVVSGILLTKEKTVTLTRGAVVNGADGLPDTSVIAIISTTQGATTYTGTDRALVGNTVDWAQAGAEPAVGSSYQVTYRYRASVIADSFTATTITVSGGAAGGDIIVAYTSKLPRIDRICLQRDGSAAYVKGVSARANPRAPSAAADQLPLCKVTNTWMGTPVVENDAPLFPTVVELRKLFSKVFDHDRLIQLERLKSGIDSREPVAKKGMFVDPFTDDTYRDFGTVQTGAIGNSMLQLSISPSFHVLDMDEAIMLEWVEDVVVSQPLKTGCVKINEYANFIPLPGAMQLSPAADFWTESRTDWSSEATLEFNLGVAAVGGPLQTVTAENQLIDSRIEQLAFLRQISINFMLSGFGIGEILESLTFDGIDVKPAGVQTADGNGVITGSFVIPAGVTAGVKQVQALGVGDTPAVGIFAGQGVIAVDTMRRVTTIQNWSQASLVVVQAAATPAVSGDFVIGQNDQNIPWGTSGGGDQRSSPDPQAQIFAVQETRQIVGVDIHLCNIGDTGNHLLVDQVSTDNGYPTTDISAESLVSMIGAVEGWKPARYNLPVTTPSDRRHAFVIKSDDNLHSVSIASLGGFDADLQQRVTQHPYVTGPRFSSVNAATWTAHQDEALAFRIVAAKYPVTTKTVELGSFDLVDCSDLQIRAAVELPAAGCSVVFEIERTNGTIYRLLPFQVLQLTEYLTETVEVRAVLNGTEKLSPVLYAPAFLVAGEIAEEMTYITRAFDLGTGVRIANYFKTFLPGGATVAVDYSIDGGAWTALPLDDTEALAFPLWTERKHEATGLTGDLVRLRLTGTGGPAARLIVGDFGAGIF